MRKAVSEIVVMVMVLMIVATLAGTAIFFMTGFAGQTTSEVGQSNTQSLKKLGSCLQIVSFDENTNNLKIKNCGRYPVDNVSVFVDSNLTSLVVINAKPNEIKNIAISTALGIHEIKISGDYTSATVAINVIGVQINFFIKNDAGENVAQFGGQGNIYIKGICTATVCGSPPANAPFIVQNSAGAAVSYVDNSGNLCIQDSNCNDNDANCNSPGDGSFIIQNNTGSNVAYINSTGNLCLIGALKQNSNL